MTLTQVGFRARNDDAPLNTADFSYGPNEAWVQKINKPFRVRFAVTGTGTVGGTLEFRKGTGGSFAPVTDTSGTVQVARSEHFSEDQPTSALLTDPTSFVAGAGDEQDGTIPVVALTAEHTEGEWCVQLVGADLATGGPVSLRVAGLDAYTRTATCTVHLTKRERVRLMVGDTDETEPLLADAEIDAHLADWPDNVDLAAASAAQSIGAMFARGYDFATDGQSFNRSQRVNHYALLAASLRKRAGVFSIPVK